MELKFGQFVTDKPVTPADAKFPGFAFKGDNGRNYFLGMFSINNPAYPDVCFLAMIREEDGGKWSYVVQRQEIWSDQESFIPDTQMIESFIITCNEALRAEPGMPADPADINKDGVLSFYERLSRFLATAVTYNASSNKLVFTPFIVK